MTWSSVCHPGCFAVGHAPATSRPWPTPTSTRRSRKQVQGSGLTRTNPNGLRLVELSPAYRGDRRGAETTGFAKSSDPKAISARPLAA
jgi:hypothetical protein